MRATTRPHFLVLDTYRLAPHSKGDDLRPEEEVEAPAASIRCCCWAASSPRTDTSRADALHREVDERIAGAVAARAGRRAA